MMLIKSARFLSVMPSLSVPLPGIPALKAAHALPKPRIHQTTLSNGLRVCSIDNYGQSTSIGVFVNGGSRNETTENAGITHFTQKLAFCTTKNRPNRQQLANEINDQGSELHVNFSRESMNYDMRCLRGDFEKAFDQLSDMILNPSLSSIDLQDARDKVAFDIEDMAASPNRLVQELLHTAAFGSESGLGRPFYCSHKHSLKFTKEDVKAHMESLFSADNVVVSAVDVDHDLLVKQAEKYFSNIPKVKKSKLILPTYVGGEIRMHVPNECRSEMEIMVAPKLMTHLGLIFKVGGVTDEDYVAQCVLHVLLGGGSSFSSGGPGKGMYSKLYTEVLNKYHWVESAISSSFQYSDVGLFGIYGTTSLDASTSLVQVFLQQLMTLKFKKVDEVYFHRAKNQLKSSVLMNLENRSVLCEDMARQLLCYGKIETGPEVCKKIDAITREDIQRVAMKFLESKPSLASFGDLGSVPEVAKVEDWINILNKNFLKK